MLEKSFKITSRLVLITVLELILYVTCVSGAELSDILRSASQMPKRLSSYQFTVLFEGDAKNKEDQAAPQITQFSQSGGLFVVDSQLKDGDYSIDDDAKSMLQHIIYAFNGSKYQWYIVGRDTVSFSDTCRHPNLYFFPNPLILPYYWLVTAQSNWSDIKNEEIWNKRFAEAMYAGEITINDKICDVITLPDHEGNKDRKIFTYFARDLGSYPLRVKIVDLTTNAIVFIDVEQYTVKQTEMGEFVFPLVITLKHLDKAQIQVQMSWKLLSESLQVNPSLDDDLFTISTSRIGTVIDYDDVLKSIGAEKAGAVIEQVITPRNKWRRMRIVVMIVNVLFIGLFIAFLVYRKRKNDYANKT